MEALLQEIGLLFAVNFGVAIGAVLLLPRSKGTQAPFESSGDWPLRDNAKE